MESVYNWISDVTGLRFISCSDKAIRIQSTLEAYFNDVRCELNDYHKSLILHLVKTTDVSIKDIVSKIAQFTFETEAATLGLEWEMKQLFVEIDGIARLNNDSWFYEYASLDRFHFSKRKWCALISKHFGIEIKSYQMKPISNANELANLIASLLVKKNNVQNQIHDLQMNSDSKPAIEQELISIINFCKIQLVELEATAFKHPSLEELRDQYLSQLRSIIEEFMNLTNLIQNGIVWDHLVVAFFGETNAGKSTLIETLRLNYGTDDSQSWNHGDIVGDGQADYTKEATEYDITINNKKVTLIDVPGIEGDEAKYADVIEKALRKAHVVFYVQGKNKKPDAKIAEKIGRYLSDWSRVYSIYNVRNSLDDFDPEQLNDLPDTLKTDKNIDLQNQIQGVLSDILGNVYQGGLLMNGLVGLSVSSDFEHSAKWHNLHKQAIRLFGNRERALEFSNIKEWIALMDACSNNFETVILDSNRQKMAGLKAKGVKMFKSIEDSQRRDVENLRSRFHSLKNSISSLFSHSIMDTKQRPTSEVNRILNELKSTLVNIVISKSSNEQKVRRAKSAATATKNKLNSRIENELSDNIAKLKQSLRKYFSEFKHITLKLPQMPDISVEELDLNIDDAFENLKVSLSDVCSAASTVLGSAGAGAAAGSFFVPGVGTLVGAGVGFLLGAIGKACMSDGGRGNAVQDIRKEIEICKESAIEEISKSTSVIVSNLMNCKRQTAKIIDNELLSMNDLSESLNMIYQKFTLRL